MVPWERSGPAVAVLCVTSLLAIALLLPLTIPQPGFPLEADYGQSLSPDYGYLQSDSVAACGCHSAGGEAPADWATTEREISNAHFAQSESVPDPRGLSTWAWAWGQFIDHDVVRTVSSEAAEDEFSVAFDGEIQLTLKRVTHRVLPASAGGCVEPHSEISPAIDGTTVYGDYHNETHARSLRTNGGTGCELALDANGYLPVVDGSLVCGDTRCGEHAVLSTLHTVFAREHNRWCSALHQRDPAASPDTRFYQARALVIAQIQHITYAEWLPALLGSQTPLLSGAGAHAGTGLRIANAFAGAAYRFGHSMVGNSVGPWPLVQLFFNTSFLPTQTLGAVIEAAGATPAERVDPLVVDGLRNFLFGSFGEDLVTRNLFRGRETRVPPYTALAACYGFPAHPAAQLFRDPLLSLLSEPLVPGSSLPRGLATIVAEQFRRLRDYDPAFYTKRLARGGAEQTVPFYGLAAQSTLGGLFRLHSAPGTVVARNVFFV